MGESIHPTAGTSRSGGCRLALLAALWLAPVRDTDAAPGLTEATDVTVCEYSSRDMSLTGQVHASRIFIDYERRGFFRIGLLPLLVAETVQVHILAAEYLTNGLGDLAAWELPPAARRLEVRGLTITLGGEREPRLQAATARPGRTGEIDLTDVCFQGAGGPPVRLPEAVLHVSGPAAGRLCWQAAGQAEERPLFPISASATTKNKP